MRRALLALAAVVALALLALLALPWLFRDRLLERAQAELGRHVDADIALGKLDVLVLPSFPDLTLVVSDLQVHGRGEFLGRELLRLDELRLTVDLRSVMGGGALVISGVEVGEGRVSLYTDAEGRSNADILPESTRADAAPADTAAPPPELELRRLRVRSLDLQVEDLAAGTRLVADSLSLDAQASLGARAVKTRGKLAVGALSYTSGGIPLLQRAPVQLDLDLEQEQESGRIHLGDTRLRLSALQLGARGSVLPGPRGTELDLELLTPGLDFAGLLSLVPAAYKGEASGLQAGGTVALSGSIKGLLPAEGEDLPAFDLALRVEDGRFRYPDLPSSVEDVQLDLRLHHPGGPRDLVEIDLPRFQLNLGGAPLAGSLRLRHPLSDPDVQLQLRGQIDLERLAQVVPPDPGSQSTGEVRVDLDLSGRVSAFQAQDLDRVTAKGTIAMNGVRHKSADMPEEIVVERLTVQVDPRAFDMAELSLRFGRSDLQGRGRLDNVLGWALTDAPLSGSMALESRLLDLGPYMNDEAESSSSNPEDSSLVAVPSNLDIDLSARFQRVLTDTHDLRDVRGELQIADGQIRMRQLRADTMGGQIELSGTYAAPTDRAADVDLNITLRSLDLSELTSKVGAIGTIAPVAKTAKGRASSSVSVQARLRPDLSPEIQSISSRGGVQANGVSLRPVFLERLGEKLNNEKLKSLQLQEAGIKFQLEQGRLKLGETPVRVGEGSAKLRGSTGVLDQTLDLFLDLELPVSQLQGQGLAGELLSSVSPGGKLPVTVAIGGTYDKPTLKLDASKAGAGLKDAVGAVVDQVKDEALDRAQAEVDRLIAEARRQGDKLVAEAEAAAAKLAAEAKKKGDALRAEAKKQGDKLIADAKGNPVKEAAAKEGAKKLRQEADKAADKLEAEAKKTGDAGVSKARAERERLIADAEKKSRLR